MVNSISFLVSFPQVCQRLTIFISCNYCCVSSEILP